MTEHGSGTTAGLAAETERATAAGTTASTGRSPSGRAVSRRGVLLAGLAGATQLGWLAVPSGAQGRDRATLRPSARDVRPATPVAARSPAPASATPVRSVRAVGSRRSWSAPIFSLDDVLRRDPRLRFPRRSIMLTIDDGPDPVWTPKYLRLLAHHEVRATFCMIGRQVRPNRAIARAVVAHGHAVANHTWTHDEALESRPRADLRAEITRTSDAISAATGREPALFRAPGGAWGPRLLTELNRQRLAPLGWDVDPRDWALPGVGAIESAMLAARRHDIILCHDGGGDRSQTYAALRRVVPALLDRGFTFVTLPALP